MKILRNTMFGALTLLVLVAAKPAAAQHNTRVAPLVGPGAQSATTPRLGFYGQVQPNWGLMITSVTPGSLAARYGLEPGDVIMSIGGRRINCFHDYLGGLQAAVNYQGGNVTLMIDNVRTRTQWGSGRPEFRTINLYGYAGGCHHGGHRPNSGHGHGGGHYGGGPIYAAAPGR